MEIEFKPEDVEAYVKAALVKSSIGKVIDKAVTSCLTVGYDNPIDREMKAIVSQIAAQIIKEKYQDQVKELVTAYIEKMVTKDMLDKLTDTAVQKMVKAMEDRY